MPDNKKYCPSCKSSFIAGESVCDRCGGELLAYNAPASTIYTAPPYQQPPGYPLPPYHKPPNQQKPPSP